jgi:drug/metabolite transporter (DMT)-like permease
VFGWALLGETLFLSDILGGLLTLGGLALLLRARRQ